MLLENYLLKDNEYLCLGLPPDEGQNLVVLLLSLHQVPLSQHYLIGLNIVNPTFFINKYLQWVRVLDINPLSTAVCLSKYCLAATNILEK